MCIYCVAALVVFVSHLIVFIGDSLNIFRWKPQCAFSTVSRIAFSLSLTLWMWPRCEHRTPTNKKIKSKMKMRDSIRFSFFLFTSNYIFIDNNRTAARKQIRKKNWNTWTTHAMKIQMDSNPSRLSYFCAHVNGPILICSLHTFSYTTQRVSDGYGYDYQYMPSQKMRFLSKNENWNVYCEVASTRVSLRNQKIHAKNYTLYSLLFSRCAE